MASTLRPGQALALASVSKKTPPSRGHRGSKGVPKRKRAALGCAWGFLKRSRNVAEASRGYVYCIYIYTCIYIYVYIAVLTEFLIPVHMCVNI